VDECEPLAVGAAPPGAAWVRVLDSGLPSPADCTPVYLEIGAGGGSYAAGPHAVAVLELVVTPDAVVE
jgi:hypothetical protein